MAYRSRTWRRRQSAQVLVAEVAQGGERRNRPDVRRVGESEECVPALQRRLQERLTGDAPHLAAAIDEPPPVLLGGAAERRSEGAGRLGRIDSGHGHRTAVGEVVAEGRLDRLEVDRLLERAAGLEEQVPVHRGQGEQARAGVERESVPAVGGQLAAVGPGLLEDRHAVPAHGEPGGDGHAAGPRADDDDVPRCAAVAGHRRSSSAAMATGRPFQEFVPARWRCHDTRLRATKAAIDAGWPAASGMIRSPVRRATMARLATPAA